MSLSARGIARPFLQRRGGLSVQQVFFDGAGGTRSLWQRLDSLARQEISFDVSECIYTLAARYEQTWSHIRVRVQLAPDAGITAATMSSLQATWQATIEARWSNRFGIGRPPGRQDPADFVLKRFSGAERKELEFAVDLAADAAEALLHDGLEPTQNRFHALSG